MLAEKHVKDPETALHAKRVTYAVSGAVICGIVGYCYYSYLNRKSAEKQHREYLKCLSANDSGTIASTYSVSSTPCISESVSTSTVCDLQFLSISLLHRKT